jgi:hypothetical protein
MKNYLLKDVPALEVTKKMKGKLCCWPALCTMLDYLTKNDGNYLEIGIYNGVSISILANKLQNKIFYGIDPFISDGNIETEQGVIQLGTKLSLEKENALYNMKDINNIKFYELTSKEFLEKNRHTIKDMNISSILVDGSHIYKDILVDIEICVTALSKGGGIIYFDDTHIADVKKAVDYFIGKYGKIIQSVHNNLQNGCVINVIKIDET